MKILIAEDEPVLQIINQELMESWGFSYDLVHNGVQAIDYALKNKGNYQLGIMDIEMPIMNGIEATLIIRAHLPYFPILAYSSSINYRKACFDAGMDEFLDKCCHPDMLLNKIRQLTLNYEYAV